MRLARIARPALSAALAPVRARPVGSAGVAAFATLFAMLAANALYHQPGRHPKPLLVTRPQPGDAVPVAEEEPSGLMPVPLVAELQTALAKAGYYTRAVDGLPGKATAAAIRAFQSDNGMAVDGEPSPRLLASIEAVTEAGPGGGERVASLDSSTTASDETGSVTVPSAAPSPDLVRQIQAGLAAARVAELKPDGILGEQTRRAIRTFETLQGLPVTGEPDARLLERLKTLGRP